MKSLSAGFGYNERLFSEGLRAKLHMARFHWFQAEIMSRSDCLTDTILELGCFDGKLINYLPGKPSRYVGFDANWEGGLDMALETWSNEPAFQFFQASSPQEMCLNDTDIFHVAVIMETLEHVPPQIVSAYLQKISLHLNGYLFVTVPNEKGIVFLSKWLVKRIFSKDAEQYTLSELIYATIGRMDRVERKQHKGFDYKLLIENIEDYFEIKSIAGHPFGFLHPSLCFGIGIVAKSKSDMSIP